MSQRTHEKPNPKSVATSKETVQAPMIFGLSPDDGIGVKSDPTCHPPTPAKSDPILSKSPDELVTSPQEDQASDDPGASCCVLLPG